MFKIFLHVDPKEKACDVAALIESIRKVPNTKIYLLGNMGFDWEMVNLFNLDGLLIAPDELQQALKTK